MGAGLATQFRSALWRGIWLATLFSFAIDIVVVLVWLLLFGGQGPVLLWAILVPLAVYVAQAILAGYGALKRLAWFHLFEREERIREVLGDFARMHLPDPSNYYFSPDEYLAEVAKSDECSADARAYAAGLSGALAAQRQTGFRLEGLLSSYVVEKAIQRYADRLS